MVTSDVTAPNVARGRQVPSSLSLLVLDHRPRAGGFIVTWEKSRARIVIDFGGLLDPSRVFLLLTDDDRFAQIQW